MAMVTMYSTKWCGYCKRLKRSMAAAGIDFTEINIDEFPEFGPTIESLTGGYRTVPTLEICGDWLVNPTLDEVTTAVEGCAKGAA